MEEDRPGRVEGVSGSRRRERRRLNEARRRAERRGDAHKARRIAIVVGVLFNNMTATAAAREHGVDRRTVRAHCDAYEKRGLAGLEYRNMGGRKPRLNKEQKVQIVHQRDRHTPEELGSQGKGWTPAELGRLIEKLCGVKYQRTHLRRLQNEFGG